MAREGFKISETCEDPTWCRLNGICRGAAQIRNRHDPNMSQCEHPEAVAARKEMDDLYDPNKPLPGK